MDKSAVVLWFFLSKIRYEEVGILRIIASFIDLIEIKRFYNDKNSISFGIKQPFLEYHINYKSEYSSYINISFRENEEKEVILVSKCYGEIMSKTNSLGQNPLGFIKVFRKEEFTFKFDKDCLSFVDVVNHTYYIKYLHDEDDINELFYKCLINRNILICDSEIDTMREYIKIVLTNMFTKKINTRDCAKLAYKSAKKVHLDWFDYNKKNAQYRILNINYKWNHEITLNISDNIPEAKSCKNYYCEDDTLAIDEFCSDRCENYKDPNSDSEYYKEY